MTSQAIRRIAQGSVRYCLHSAGPPARTTGEFVILAMTTSIAPILCLGLILCTSIVPPSAAFTDIGLWEYRGSGNPANQAVLYPDTREQIERPLTYNNTSGKDGIDRAGIQKETELEERAGPATASDNLNYDPGSVIVRFKPGVADSPALPAQKSDAAHARLGPAVTADYGGIGLQVMRLPAEMPVAEAVNVYSRNPDVLYAEPNYYYYLDAAPDERNGQTLKTLAADPGDGEEYMPDDTYFSQLWGLHNTGQTVNSRTGTADADIDAPEAWCITTGSRDVIVAVIDSGVMYAHPDLAANIWTNPGEIPDNGIDDDGNGYIDDVHGWDFYDDDNTPDDLHGHGTHCAGTIAAVGNNSLGVAGVMWNAQVMPLRFLGADGKGTAADAVQAIQYATMMGADVISCSWGGSSYSQALKEAIDATPALVVCAAGNDAWDNDIKPHYPSSYTSENILAVAASTSTEQLASFSHFGATSVDVAAPGEGILSTSITGSSSPSYAYRSGTSMATPHVSGVAGLVRSVNASLSATEIKDVIISTTDPKPAYTGKMVSGGRVNAYGAVCAVVPGSGRPLSIVASKDSVVRGNCFVVTVSGEPSRSYWVYVKDAAIPSGEYPLIAPGQVGVMPGVTMTDVADAADSTYTRAQVATNAGGTRVIQFNTSHATRARDYTVTVVDPADAAVSDDVVVAVEPGFVTVTPSGTGVYYIGDEITFSGTNTDSATTYLFLTGPNLAADGVGLSDITVPVEDGNLTTFTSADVEADETWLYRWNTAETGLPLDAGGYTIYAVSAPRNKANLSDARYATFTVQVRVPILIAGPSDVVLAPGDEHRITGIATGRPDCVYTWIFGENYRRLSRPANVSSDDSFEYTISPDETGTLAPGQYFVVIQHPMMNREQDVTCNTTHPVTGEPGRWLVAPGMTPVDLADLQPSDAVPALADALDLPDVDDIYTRLTFEVADPTLLANVTANVTAGTAPLTVQFTDTSIRDPTDRSWDFGDGNTSTEQHPVHTYALPGNHTVTLAVDGGRWTCTKPGYIKVTPVLFGDANEDGAVNQADTLLVLQEVVGLRERPDAGTDGFRKTDVNTNDVIEIGDALFIAQYNVGLRDVWFEVI